jgi:hypothetical protein
MKRTLFLIPAILLFVILSSPGVYGEENQKSLELAAGGGTTLDGDHFRHLLIAPSLAINAPNPKILVYRIEADFEFIKAGRRITEVMGLAPFLRIFATSKKQGPFLELGAGANAITNNHTGRKNSGGAFIFSLMGGAGYKFSVNDKPFSVSVRLRHLSNGHIYRINEGINSVLLLASIGL